MSGTFADLARSFAMAEGLAANDGPVDLLTGGISAEIVRVGSVVVKRARPELDVADRWAAPLDRILVEAAAIAAVGAPTAPALRAVDPARHLLALDYVPGENWRDRLLAGRVDAADFESAGRALRRIHDTAYQPPTGVPAQGYFEELRLVPYFAAAAKRNPMAASALGAVLDRLRASNRTVLVHGDYSPKNLLCTSDGVVVLDWEVAHLGEPEFDLAFVLSHVIAKQVHLPHLADLLGEGQSRLLAAYGASVDQPWLDQLLGALLVARADGQSPLTYLTTAQVERLRQRGMALLNGDSSIETVPTIPNCEEHTNA